MIAWWVMPALSLNSQEELMRISRETLESFVRQGEMPSFKPEDTALSEPVACFVTLKKRREGDNFPDLRGCVGVLKAQRPLFEEVMRMTQAAASQDFRFEQVRPQELQEIRIEISVLSPLERIHSQSEIEVGRHGVFLKWKDRSGAFLPEVAPQAGWTAEELVRACAQEKAFLPEEAWREAEIYRFTTQKIKEGA